MQSLRQTSEITVTMLRIPPAVTVTGLILEGFCLVWESHLSALPVPTNCPHTGCCSRCGDVRLSAPCRDLDSSLQLRVLILIWPAQQHWWLSWPVVTVSCAGNTDIYMCVCVCVCAEGMQWYLQHTHTTIVTIQCCCCCCWAALHSAPRTLSCCTLW